MQKPAPVDHPVHALIRDRWSPRAFADRAVSEADLRSLFEAARWAPSSFNDQPWAFLVATRDQADEHARTLDLINASNQLWAQRAPVLIIACARVRFRRFDKPNRHAWHDLGLAVSQLTLEATARGLVLHQMAGFDAARSHEVFALPEEWEAVSAIALGYPGEPDDLPEALAERERGERRRFPQTDFVFTGGFGRSRGG